MAEAIVDEDTIILPSGRRLEPNCGIVGLCVSPDFIRLPDRVNRHATSGWDDQLYDDRHAPLSDEDRRALADLMIRRWTEFGAGAEVAA